MEQAKPFVKPNTEDTEDIEVFRKFVKAGKRLAELHVKYEEQPDATELKPGPATGGGGATKTRQATVAPAPSPAGPISWIQNPEGKVDYRVEKMRLSKDKSTLAYNDYWTLTNIPAEVYEYRLGNRSALEWIVDQYQVSTDKRSGITNDPNREDDPQYTKRIIGQVIYVSLETVKVVKGLPELVIAESAAAPEAKA